MFVSEQISRHNSTPIVPKLYHNVCVLQELVPISFWIYRSKMTQVISQSSEIKIIVLGPSYCASESRYLNPNSCSRQTHDIKYIHIYIYIYEK